MRLLVATWYLLAGLAAATSNGMFYNPPAAGLTGVFSGNPIYSVGLTVLVRWTTDWDRVSLGLRQYGDSNSVNLLSNVTNPNNYNWIIETKNNISIQDSGDGNVFALILHDAGTGNEFTSRYFNLTNASTATAPTASSTTSNLATFSPITALTTNSGSTPKSSLILGLAIGVPLTLLALAMFMFLWFRYRRRAHPYIRTEPDYSTTTMAVQESTEEMQAMKNCGIELKSISPLHEANTTDQKHEMHSSKSRYELDDIAAGRASRGTIRYELEGN